MGIRTNSYRQSNFPDSIRAAGARRPPAGNLRRRQVLFAQKESTPHHSKSKKGGDLVRIPSPVFKRKYGY